MSSPEVSVVMAVFNGQSQVASTIQSILLQNEVDFEFIIVNDGSSDESRTIIEAEQERDQRIILLNQENQGLTKALINGCSIARGRFIARQDVGDTSLPGRLALQRRIFEEKEDAVMVSTGTSFVAPDGEEVYSVIQDDEQAMRGLTAASASQLKGPSHHGSVMFDAQIYRKVGGYRPEFIVAQDLDLWTRLIEYGKHYSLPNQYYIAILEKGSISMLHRDLQISTTQLIWECIQARALEGSDSSVITKAAMINRPNPHVKSNTEKLDSDYFYFIGSNVLTENPQAAIKYFRSSLRSYPFRLKTILKLIYAHCLKYVLKS